jgi:hypothetical protein
VSALQRFQIATMNQFFSVLRDSILHPRAPPAGQNSERQACRARFSMVPRDERRDATVHGYGAVTVLFYAGVCDVAR